MPFCFISFQVTHMGWTGQHCTFIVETFIKNESITAMQREFHVHYGFGRQDPIPTQNTISLWVTNFRATGSALKWKLTGRLWTTRTLEVVNVSIQQSLRCPVWKHTATLDLSIRSLRKILHKNLQMHPYKMILVQELSERDQENYSVFQRWGPFSLVW